jgi:hypothetical protein
LLTIFAGLACCWRCSGIYGVLAYFVTQHTQELACAWRWERNLETFSRWSKRGMSLVVVGWPIGLAAAFA